MFGIAEHPAVAVDLLVGKTVQIFAPAVADEGGAEDEIHHHAVVVLHAAVRAHSVDLAFLVADDADLLLKWIERLDQAAHRFLHPSKGRIDLGSTGEFARLQQHHFDFLFLIHCKNLLSSLIFTAALVCPYGEIHADKGIGIKDIFAVIPVFLDLPFCFFTGISFDRDRLLQRFGDRDLIGFQCPLLLSSKTDNLLWHYRIVGIIRCRTRPPMRPIGCTAPRCF